MNKYKQIKKMSASRLKLNLGLALASPNTYDGKIAILALELRRRKKVERTEFVKKILDVFDFEEWDPD